MSNPHDIFSFLIRPLREADRGTDLLRRFLLGPQEQFDAYWARVDQVRLLVDYRRCPDQYLGYLKDVVGIRDADVQRMDLAGPTLRRFVSTAVALWKVKGTAYGLLLGAEVLTGQPVRLADWFRRRALLGEVVLEGPEGDAPFVYEQEPGGALHQEYVSQLHVADNGAVNHAALRYLLDLLRPASERLDVVYNLFLDYGSRLSTLWTAVDGTLAAAADGSRTLTPGLSGRGLCFPVTDGSAWTRYSLRVRGRFGTDPGASFRLVTQEAGPAGFLVDYTATGIVVWTWSGAVSSRSLLGALSAALYPGVDYTFQLEVEPFPGGAAVAVYLDGTKRGEFTTNALTGVGTAGVGCLTSPAAFRTVAVLPRPAVVERVGPNP